MNRKYFVLTGRLNSMSREEAVKNILNHGGIVQNMVTPQTDYLIVGGFQINMFEPNRLSRKRQTAERLNELGAQIDIISEERFLEWLKQDDESEVWK